MSVTVIIPTTNERKKYHESIYRNYISQTYINKKMIVYEDGNESKPSKFWENKSQKHDDITYIHSDIKHTIGQKRNEMIEKSNTEYIAHFDDDEETKGVVIIGEIGGSMENEAAEWIKNNFNKPVVSFIAGQTAPKGKRMGHAGAIISEGSETADAKIKILKECGVSVAKTVSEIGETMLQLIEE